MPVLSESSAFRQASTPCSRISKIEFPRILAALVFLSCVIVVIRRRIARKTALSTLVQRRGLESKYRNEKTLDQKFGYKQQDPRIVTIAMMMPGLPMGTLFTAPTLDETNERNVRNLESVPTSPVSFISQSSSTAFDEVESALKIQIPRRRSYTKMIGSMKGGNEPTEVTGEILVSPDGWRRHTRVFGGGVCKACEESKKVMSV